MDTVNKYLWGVWGVLTVDGPHWVCHSPRRQNLFLLDHILLINDTLELSFCELEMWVDIRLKITFTSVTDALVMQ